MAQILRDTNTKVPKWLNNMETSSRQGYETPTKAPAPSERRAELARVLVLSGELKHQPACLGAYTLVAGGAVHGRPVWRHERGDRCIAKLASGKWAVQKEENVGVNGLCFLRVFDANVLFPHQSPVAWEEWGGKGGWPAEAGLKCDADPPPATTSTARTPGRVGSGGQTAPVQRQGRPVQPPSFGRGQYDSFSDSEDESQSRRGHEIAFVKSIDSVEQGRSSNQMSDNDHGGRESASSKVRFHTQGKESKGSYASSSRSGGKSYVYEEEGESERSQQWGPQIGGKCERDFIGYSNSYNGNSNRRQQQLKASAQGRYGEVTCSRDAELQGGFGREDSFFCKEDSLSEGYGSVTSERSAPEYPFQRESAKAGRRCSSSSRR